MVEQVICRLYIIGQKQHLETHQGHQPSESQGHDTVQQQTKKKNKSKKKKKTEQHVTESSSQQSSESPEKSSDVPAQQPGNINFLILIIQHIIFLCLKILLIRCFF